MQGVTVAKLRIEARGVATQVDKNASNCRGTVHGGASDRFELPAFASALKLKKSAQVSVLTRPAHVLYGHQQYLNCRK